MKLSHAASTTLTAIAELRRAIGVGSGALLGIGFPQMWWKSLGHILNQNSHNPCDCR